jgi:SAM-dependent methyltransferase
VDPRVHRALQAEVRVGWFVIEGVQEGSRTLEQQVTGLDGLDVSADSVLELGCAEGLMSRWLVKRGARRVVGVDSRADHIAVARVQCAGVPVELRTMNLDNELPMAKYDTVLALAVLHKLRDPAFVAAHIATIAARQIVLRLPPATAPVVVDERSGNKRIDVEAPLLRRGWRRVQVTRGPFDEWTAFYARDR